jgi:hypothetical protein
MRFKNTKIILMFLSLYIVFLGLLPAFASDDSAWQEFLGLYLKDGLVNYSAVQADSASLNRVVSQLENVKKEEYGRWSQDEKKAFWINAYNIGAIKLVVDHYPLRRSIGLQALRYPADSIQQIPGVWDQEALTVLGEKVSLNDIENDILMTRKNSLRSWRRDELRKSRTYNINNQIIRRPVLLAQGDSRKEFPDSRIHFAVVCASLGCPVLRGEPYVSARLDAQLEDQAGKFTRDTRKVRYDPSKDTLYVSPVFKWFKEDFERGGGAAAFVKGYMPSDIKWSDGVEVR